MPPWASQEGSPPRGGGEPGLPIKASELRVLEGTYENKNEGLGGRAGLGPVDKSEGWGSGPAQALSIKVRDRGAGSRVSVAAAGGG